MRSNWSTGSVGAMRALGLEKRTPRRPGCACRCLLSDIAWRAHPEYRGDQGLNMLAYGAFIGVGHPGRAYLALAIITASRPRQ